MSKGKYRKCSLRQNVEKKKHVKGKYRKENIEGKIWNKTDVCIVRDFIFSTAIGRY